MALTKPIQDTFQGNPISATYQPVAAEVTTLITELQDGSLPVYKAASILAIGAGGFGFGAGAGGVVTQITSKATAVTLDKPCGIITTHAAALAAGASVEFTLNSTEITVNDVIIPSMQSPVSKYTVATVGSTAGTCILRLTNYTAGSLSEAVKINFAVINVVSV